MFKQLRIQSSNFDDLITNLKFLYRWYLYNGNDIFSPEVIVAGIKFMIVCSFSVCLSAGLRKYYWFDVPEKNKKMCLRSH